MTDPTAFPGSHMQPLHWGGKIFRCLVAKYHDHALQVAIRFWRARESVGRNACRLTSTVSTVLLCASYYLGEGLLRRVR